MREGKRNGDHPDARVAEALDACVVRMREGDSLEQCLADFPDLAAELRALLGVAEALDGRDGAGARSVSVTGAPSVGRSTAASDLADTAALTGVTPPPAPRGLRPGRARMLAAAQAMRSGTTPQAAGMHSDPAFADPVMDGQAARTSEDASLMHGAADLPELLDRALARIAAGVSTEQILAELAGRPRTVATLRPLLDTAQRVQAAAVEPQASAALAAGLDRLLATARSMASSVTASAAQTATKPADARNGHASKHSVQQTFATDGLAPALDAAIERITGGSDVHAALSAHRDEPAVAAALAPLLDLAAHLRSDVWTVPDKDAAVARARSRFLTVAATARSVVQAAGASLEAAHESAASELVHAAQQTDTSAADERSAAAGSESDWLDAALTWRREQPLRSAMDALRAVGVPAASRPELMALLSMAEHAQTEAVVPPVPSEASARERFLAAASVAASAVAQDHVSPALLERLDQAVARVKAGTNVESALLAAGTPADQAMLRDLLAVAGWVTTDHVTAPIPADGLAAGRARFLAVGAEARRHRVAMARTGQRAAETRRPVRETAVAAWFATLRGFVNGGLASGPRAAAMAAGVLLMFLGANAVAYPAYANTLPGEPLYAMKRLSRSTRLVVVGALSPVSPERADTWRGQIEQDRVQEVRQLQDDGRKEVAEFSGRLAGYQRVGEGSSGYGSIHVAVEQDEPDLGLELVIVGWDADTEFSLPAGYPDMDAVPRGAPISVRVQTGTERLRALRVRIGLLTPTEVLTATPTTTATQRTPASPNPSGTGTPTLVPTVPVSATATLSATLTPAASPTVSATATIPLPTLTPVLTPTLAATPTATPPRPGKSVARPDTEVVRGYVVDLSHNVDAGHWVLVLQIGEDAANQRKIDVSALALDKNVATEWSAMRPGARVALDVLPRDDGRMWVAKSFAGRVKAPSCSNGQRIAVVAAYEAGQSLRLHGEDTEFRLNEMAEDALVGQVEAGVRVQLHYRDCGLAGLYVERLRVLDNAADGGTQQPAERTIVMGGTVKSVDRDASPMRVEFEDFDGRRWHVDVPSDTSIQGGTLDSLAAGIRVQLTATIVDENKGLLRASKFQLFAPPPTGTPMPTATLTPPVPTATPTVEPIPTPTVLPDGGAPGIEPPPNPGAPGVPPPGQAPPDDEESS